MGHKAVVLFAGLTCVIGAGCLGLDVGPPTESDAGAVSSCRHETCTGCCYLGECVSGYRDDACGNFGHRCDICANDEMCSPARSCVERPPDAGPPVEWVPYSSPAQAPDPGDTEGSGAGKCVWYSGNRLCM